MTTHMLRARLGLSTSLCALMAMASATQAQTRVPTQSAASENVIMLDTLVVTSTRQEQSAINSMSSTSVATGDQIQEQQPQRIGTILSQMPGVTTQENPNDPATAVNIRGLQDFGRVAVTIDGARQNFQRSGHNANGAFFLDPSFVRSVDVTRGPVANVYGSGAIGGVVSFETIRPDDILRPHEKYAIQTGGAGLFGRQSGATLNAVGAARPVDWASGLLGVSWRKFSEYKDGKGIVVNDSGSQLASGLGKIVLTPGEGHRLTLGGQYPGLQIRQWCRHGNGTAPQQRGAHGQFLCAIPFRTAGHSLARSARFGL